MSELLLSAETGRKEGTRPSRRLRREGKVPAVVYGLGADPVAVSVEWPALRKALTVPRDALVLRQGETVVFRLDAADGVERVPVSTGAAQGTRIEVRGGLEAGDRVVIRGAERLQPGQKVQVKAPSP